MVTFGEFSRTPVPTREFVSVIFPQPVWDEYLANPGSVPCPAPGMITSETLERRVGYLPDLITVPNYETLLEEVSRAIGRYIWIHGVRLPTAADVNTRHR